MVASGLESVLIGNPVDFDELTFGGGVRVRSFLDATDIFRFRSDLFLLTACFSLDSVLSLVTVIVFVIFRNYYIFIVVR